MLRRKIVKFARAARWRNAPGDRVPVHWHVGRPNFGDDINPVLFERIAGRGMRLVRRRDAPHILGMGSILGLATRHSLVIGSGLLKRSDTPIDEGATFVAVRGMLSLDRVARPEGVLLGDPMVLARDLLPVLPAKARRFGFIPHVRSVEAWKAACRGRHLVIDPGLDPLRVLELIAGCEVVFSQSLHGLVAADALGVPGVWIAPSEAMAGGDFKFRDYFTTLDRERPMVAYSPEIFANPGTFDAEAANFRFSLDAYRSRIAEAIGEHFPSGGRGEGG